MATGSPDSTWLASNNKRGTKISVGIMRGQSGGKAFEAQSIPRIVKPTTVTPLIAGVLWTLSHTE
jgi:hypothetical protein